MDADTAFPAEATDRRPLFGRVRELARARECLAAARAGRGGGVLIGGEAGIGKTTLVEALGGEAAAAGARLLLGRGDEFDATAPYGHWADLFGQLPGAGVAGLPAAVPARAGERAQSQAALFAAVRERLAGLARERPLVLVLEDLHWADVASLELLRYLARHCASLPLLVVATYRADEATDDRPFTRFLPALIREARATRLDLRPLDDAAVAALAAHRYPLAPAELARLVGWLRERAEGNPFAIEEFLRTIEEEGILCPAGGDLAPAAWTLGDLGAVRVPALLQQILAARLARLDPPEREALAGAAVIGQEVPLALWAAVAGCGEGALRAPVERGIALHLLAEADDGERVRFAHALVRQALYERIALPARRDWHRRVADALLATAAPDPDGVAGHLRQAGDERAADWLIRAGVRALRAHAWIMAAERFARALALLEERGADPQQRGWLHLHVARLRRFTDPVAALGHLDAAIGRASGGDPALAAYARFARGVLHCFAGLPRLGIIGMEAAIADLGAAPPLGAALPATLVGLGLTMDVYDRRGTLAFWLAMVGRTGEAQAPAAAALASHPLLTEGEAAPSIDVHLALALAHAAAGRPDEARAAFARARAESRNGENLALLAVAIALELVTLGLPYGADDPAALHALAAEAEDASVRASGVADSISPRLTTLPLLMVAGRWGEAREVALAGWAAGSVYRPFVAPALVALAMAQGDGALAWRTILALLPDGPATVPGDAIFFAATALQRAATRLALDGGDLPAARGWLDAHDRWLAWGGATGEQAEGQLLLAEYQRAAGDLPAARAHGEAALAAATAPRRPLTLLAARRFLGELDTSAGHNAAAAAHLAAALALADACAAPGERALTLRALVALHRAAGRAAEAGLALAEARAIAAHLGAAALLAGLAADAAHLSPAPPAPPSAAQPAGTSPIALSPREREVLRLIAAGETNGVIAATLGLSIRTVERHIANLYNKIDARGKADATAYAFRHNLT